MRYIEAKLIQANINNPTSIDRILSANPTDNISVLSPIPRGYFTNGQPYFEETPSLSYLPQGKNGQPVFYDNALGKDDGGRNEIGLIKDLEGIKYSLAKKLGNVYFNSQLLYDKYNFDKLAKAFEYEDLETVANKYNWDKNVLKRLKCFQSNKELISIPIINNGVVLSIASYYPDRVNAKWTYSKGVHGTFIMNYDDWIYDERPTIIAEGAKDMLTLLSLGYNAISLSNGASTIPEFYPNAFKNLNTGLGKEVYIVYDNDSAGKNGAKKLAVWLWTNDIKKIKIIDISEICKNKGEDVFDFFNKYKKTKQDLDNIIIKTSWFLQKDYLDIIKSEYPLKSIKDAKKKENINKVFQTDVEIQSYSSNRQWILPESVDITYKITGYGESKEKVKTIEISEKEMFNYMKPEKVQRERILSKLPQYGLNKKNFSILEYKLTSEEFVFFNEVSQVRPLFTDDDYSGVSEFYPCYSIGKQLEASHRYRITYYITSHPDNQADLIIIIKNATELEIIEPNLELTKQEYNDLSLAFKPKINETIDDVLAKRLNDINSFIGFSLNKQRNIWLTVELLYHSVYEYQWADGKVKNGMLLTLIFGDPSGGKSVITDALRKLYGRGTIIPSNNATAPGLIGGTATREGGHRVVRNGLLASQDKGLLIMEELTYAAKDLLPKLTDLVTSGRTTVVRVDGIVDYKVRLRWLFISNIGDGKKINESRHGLIPLQTIVPTLEWYRRIDIALAVSSSALLNSDGTATPLPSSVITNEQRLKVDAELYKLKIKWVWSRTKEHIIINDELKEYIFNYTNKWIKDYGTRVNVVGDNQYVIYDKLCKITIAIATMLFSTNDGINVVLTKDHVDWAYNYLVGVYDNDVFRIKEFILETEKYSAVKDKDVQTLQELWDENEDYAQFLDDLESQELNEVFGHRDLQNFWLGEDLMLFKRLWAVLVRNQFLRPKNRGYIITEKYKNTYYKIKRIRNENKSQDKGNKITYAF